MTVFSVLKHPITVSFEEQHLALLPRWLLEGWWAECIEFERRKGKIVNVPPEPARISTYMRHHTKTQHRDRHLQVLQRSIFRLDE